MSAVVRYQPVGLTRQQYDEVTRRMEAAGAWPSDGLQLRRTDCNYTFSSGPKGT
jgi:hypothetical protein